MEQSKPSWIVKKKLHSDFKIISCKSYDDIKDFVMDDGCYILIKPHFDTKEISVALCNYTHEILLEFKGKKIQDIYNSIFDYERDHNVVFFYRKEHIAYLGKELKKAELALINNSEYVQE